MAVRPRCIPLAGAAALLCGWLAIAPAFAGTGYEIVAGESELRVLVFRGGALARLGHNHVISTTDVSGTAVVGPSPGDSSLEMTVPVRGFVVDDPAVLQEVGSAFAGERSEDDIEGTRRNMLGPDLLHAEEHDEVRITSESISGEFPDVKIHARVAVRGIEHALVLPVFVTFGDGGLVASGTSEVSHAELGLVPFEAAFGALRVAEDMIFRYRIVAREISEVDRACDRLSRRAAGELEP